MAESFRLDGKDTEILRALQHNARLSNKELAAKVNLSTTPTYERVKRLERLGFIKEYAAILNESMLNKGFAVFCSIKLRSVNKEYADSFTEMVKRIPEVTECYNISGSFDYLLKIHAPDMKYYQSFILNVLGRIEYLASLESVFVMDVIKHEYNVHI